MAVAVRTAGNRWSLTRLGPVLVVVLLILNFSEHAGITDVVNVMPSPRPSVLAQTSPSVSSTAGGEDSTFLNKLFAVTDSINVHQDDFITPGKSCRVQWCHGIDSRKLASVLFDGATGRSDTTPPITIDDLRARIENNGRRNKIEGVRWPSEEIDLAVEQGRANRSEPARGFVPTSIPYLKCARKNLVIGFAVNFGVDALQPFVSSFQRYHGPCDEAVLFVDDTKLDLHLDPRKANVKLVSRIKWVQRTPGAASLQTGNQRIPVFARYLRDRWSQYHYVVHVDTRDVMFFSNLFLPLFQHNVTGLFSAGEAVAFASDRLNQVWLTRYTGSRLAVEYVASLELNGRRMPIVCSGIYGGTTLAFLDYLAAFSAGVAVSTTIARETLGIDQGIHIYLNFFGLPLARFPHPIVLLDEGMGPIRHWYPKNTAILQDKLGRHINCDLAAYAVVHQLDRWSHFWKDAQQDYPIHPNKPGPSDWCPSTAPNNVFAAFDLQHAKSRKFVIPPRPSFLTTQVETLSSASNLPGAVRGKRRQLMHLDICESRNAIILFCEVMNVDVLQPLIAALQRYHTSCDDIVIFVPYSRSGFEAISTANHVHVQWHVFREVKPSSSKANLVNSSFADLGFRDYSSYSLGPWTLGRNGSNAFASALLLRWLKANGNAYRFVTVFEDAVNDRIAVYDNLFSPFWDASFRGLWLLPFLPGSSSSTKGERQGIVEAEIEAVFRSRSQGDCYGSDHAGEILTATAFNLSAVPTIFGGETTAVLSFLATLVDVAQRAPDTCSDHDRRLIRTHIVPAYLMDRESRFPHPVVLLDDLFGPHRHILCDRKSPPPSQLDAAMRPLRCGETKSPFGLVYGFSRAEGSCGQSWLDLWNSQYRKRGPDNMDRNEAYFETSTSGTLCSVLDSSQH